jgi:hypothetical protein
MGVSQENEGFLAKKRGTGWMIRTSDGSGGTGCSLKWVSLAKHTGSLREPRYLLPKVGKVQ